MEAPEDEDYLEFMRAVEHACKIEAEEKEEFERSTQVLNTLKDLLSPAKVGIDYFMAATDTETPNSSGLFDDCNYNFAADKFPVTKLRAAVEAGNFTACIFFLAYGADPLLFDHNSALAYALEHKMNKYVELFLKHSTPEKLNREFTTEIVKHDLCPDYRYNSFINIAVKHNNLEGVKLLLQYGAHTQNESDTPPSALAILNGNEDILLSLLKHGASLGSYQAFNDYTPILAKALNCSRKNFNNETPSVIPTESITLFKKLRGVISYRGIAPITSVFNFFRLTIATASGRLKREKIEDPETEKAINSLKILKKIIYTEPTFGSSLICDITHLKEYYVIWAKEIYHLISPFYENVKTLLMGNHLRRQAQEKNVMDIRIKEELPILPPELINCILKFTLPYIKEGILIRPEFTQSCIIQDKEHLIIRERSSIDLISLRLKPF